MSLKKVPEQSLLAGRGTWDWENEETLVDQRNRLPNRIKRLLRQTRLYIILITIIMAAMLSPGVMTFVISAMPWVFRILFAMAFMVFQFVVLFGWLARTRMYTIMPGAEGVSFDDYRGQPELLEQAQQIVMLVRGVKAFEGAGGEPLTGLLLEGPPGTGKTWLAKAISTEAGVPFFYVDTASLQGMFMGTGNMKVSGVYRKARKAAKEYGAAVIFMDEIDSVGSRGGVSRVGDSGQTAGGMGMMGGGGLLNTLLIEMSGFSLEHGWRVRLKTMFYRTFLRRNPPKPPKRVLTIGATNRIGALDPALLRPGRFDKKIHVDVPDMQGRRDIIEYYLSKMAHDETLDPAVLATETVNYTPADIKYLLNEALRYALFTGRTYMTYQDFLKAQPEHEMGLRAPLKNISSEAKKRLAYYQAGHAVAVRLFLPDHRIARITIIRQGFMMGHVSHYSARESFTGLRTKDELTDRLRVLIAGRAAEIEFCGTENQSFTALMGPPDRTHYGLLYDLLVNMSRAGMMGSMGGAMGMSGGMTPDQAKAVDELYQRVLLETRQTLRENKHIVEALVALLLEKEELMGTEVRAFFDQYNLFTPDPTVMIGGEEVSILPPTRQQPALSGD